MSDDFLSYLRLIMSSEKGRQWMHELLALTGNKIKPSPLDTVYANFYAGRRYVGELLMDAIMDLRAENGTDGLTLYAQMIREAQLRESIAEQKAMAQRELDPMSY